MTDRQEDRQEMANKGWPDDGQMEKIDKRWQTRDCPMMDRWKDRQEMANKVLPDDEQMGRQTRDVIQGIAR